MTIAVFYEDPYLTGLHAQVTAVDGDWVQFDRTVFYPEGGGQPGDTGRLLCGARTLQVVETRKGTSPGTIRHRIAEPGHGLQPGESVEQRLDWERRHRHMRMHTCLHLLCSLVPRGVTGGALTADKGRLDFDLGDGTVDKETLTRALNELVEAGHPVGIESVSEAELDSNPELVRTLSVAPPRGTGTVRLVHVQGIDRQPCGGTHVAATGEIGPVRVAKIESKGRRNRRIVLMFDE